LLSNTLELKQAALQSVRQEGQLALLLVLQPVQHSIQHLGRNRLD